MVNEQNDNVKVSVIMVTYNHERYIAEAINGVLIQQTNFLVELIIANDSSPDNTDYVVKNYLIENPLPSNIEVKYTRHEANKGGNANFIWALQQAKGKYIAMCEGDDYWTDPHKLQTQVDFLNSNSEYSFSCHRYTIKQDVNYLRTKRGITGRENLQEEFASKFYRNKDLIIDHELFFKVWVTKTLTAVFRRKFLPELLTFLTQFKFARDFHLFYFLLTKGSGLSLNRFMAVYRVHSEGVESGEVFQVKIKTQFLLFNELLEIIPTDKRIRKLYFNTGIALMSIIPLKERLSHFAKLISNVGFNPFMFLKLVFHLGKSTAKEWVKKIIALIIRNK